MNLYYIYTLEPYLALFLNLLLLGRRVCGAMRLVAAFSVPIMRAGPLVPQLALELRPSVVIRRMRANTVGTDFEGSRAVTREVLFAAAHECQLPMPMRGWSARPPGSGDTAQGPSCSSRFQF